MSPVATKYFDNCCVFLLALQYYFVPIEDLLFFKVSLMSLLQLQIIWHIALLYSRSPSNLWRNHNINILCFLFNINPWYPTQNFTNLFCNYKITVYVYAIHTSRNIFQTIANILKLDLPHIESSAFAVLLIYNWLWASVARLAAVALAELRSPPCYYRRRLQCCSQCQMAECQSEGSGEMAVRLQSQDGTAPLHAMTLVQGLVDQQWSVLYGKLSPHARSLCLYWFVPHPSRGPAFVTPHSA